MSQHNPIDEDLGLMERARTKLAAPELRRFAKFALVGGSGVVVNMVIFYVAMHHIFAGLGEDAKITWAGVLAVAVSILTNFLLNDAWTWGDREKKGLVHFSWRLAKYVLVASVAGTVQIAVLKALVYVDLHPLVANFCGIGAGIGINFVANNWWTFRAGGDDSDPLPSSPHANERESTI